MAPLQRVCFDTRSEVWILFGRQSAAQLLPPRSQSMACLSLPFSPLPGGSPFCVCLAPFFSFQAVSSRRGPGGREGGREGAHRTCVSTAASPWRTGGVMSGERPPPPWIYRSHPSCWSAPERQHIVWDSAKEGYQFHNHTDVFSQELGYFWLLESETHVGASFSTPPPFHQPPRGDLVCSPREASSRSKWAPLRGPCLRTFFLCRPFRGWLFPLLLFLTGIAPNRLSQHYSKKS